MIQRCHRRLCRSALIAGSLATLLASGACSPKCRPNSIFLKLTFANELDAALAEATQLNVSVGDNPATPTVISQRLRSGTQLEVDLGGGYQPGAQTDLHVAAVISGDAVLPNILAAGTAQLTLASGCTFVTLALTSSAGSVDITHSQIAFSTPALSADGLLAATVTVTLIDPNGLPIPDKMVMLIADGPGNTITQPTNATDVSGVTTGTLTSTALGSQTVSAMIDGVVVAEGTINFDVFPPAVIEFAATHPDHSTCVQLSYEVAQPQSLPVDIKIEYDDGSGFAELPELAQSGVSSSPAGTQHVIAWDSVREFFGDAEVRLRLTPSTTNPPRLLGDPVEYDGLSVANQLSFSFVPEDKDLIIFVSANDATSMVTGDFNGDGKLDLAISNMPTVILLGNGDGTFQRCDKYLDPPCVGQVVPVDAAPVSMIAVGDFNGDGRLDLVTANPFGQSVSWQSVPVPSLSVLLNTSDFSMPEVVSFSRQPDIGIGAQASWVSAGDFNGDGKLDLVAGSPSVDYGPSQMHVLLGNGDGSFQPDLKTDVGSMDRYSVLTATAGDFNGDGKLDLAVIFYDDPVAFILAGNGDGTFSMQTSPHLSPFPGNNYAGNSYCVTSGDLDGDGKLDLVIPGWDADSVDVLLNRSTVAGIDFAPVESFATLPVNSVATGDFNGDGRLDLALANEPEVALRFSSNNANGFLADTLNLAGYGASNWPWNPQFVISGDWNGDGKLDLAAIDLPLNWVDVFLNTGPDHCR